MRSRVNSMLARGIGVWGGLVCACVCMRDSMNERSSDSVHPLQGPRRRHYVVYLAFNLINEGRSASVVAVHHPFSLHLPPSLSLSLFLCVSCLLHNHAFFPSGTTRFSSVRRKNGEATSREREERSPKRLPPAEGRSFCPGNNGGGDQRDRGT